MPANVFGSFEDAFEQGVSSVKQTVTTQVKQTASNAASQLGVQVNDSTQLGQVDTSAALTDQFNETSSSNQQQNKQDPLLQQQAATKQLEAKDLQERQKKLAEARQRLQQLHKQTYYDPTFNRRQKEPTVQERLEQQEQIEEQKKMEDIQEAKKKEVPVALKQAQTRAEINRGASG